MPTSSRLRQDHSSSTNRSRRTHAQAKERGSSKSPKRLAVSRSYPTQEERSRTQGTRRSRNRTQPVQYRSPRNSRRKHNGNKPPRKSRHKEATASRAKVGSAKPEKIVAIFTPTAKGKRSISYVARPSIKQVIKTEYPRSASPKR